MDGTRAQLSLTHALDDGFRAHLRIATCKDTFAIRHEVVWIGLNGSPLRPLHPVFFVKDFLFDCLTDSGNDGVALDDELGPRNRYRPASPASIRLTRSCPGVFNAYYFAVFSQDTLLRYAHHQVCAFGFTVLYLFLRSTHVSASTIIRGVYFRTQAQ